MRRIIAGLAALLVSASAAEAAPLRVQSRQVAGLLVIAPPGRSPAVSTAALLEAADQVLKAESRLELRSLEQLGVDPLALDPCRTGLRLTCWARTLRRLAGDRAPRFLFVLGLLPLSDGREQATMYLLDTDRAADLLARVDGQDEEAVAAVEDNLFMETVRSAPARVSFTDPAARKAFFVEAMQVSFRGALGEAGLGTPLGRISLDGTQLGWAVRLDGAQLGGAAAGRSEILGVPAGPHEVEVDAPWQDGLQFKVNVAADQTALISIVPPPPGPSSGQLAVRYGGLVVAAAGLATLGAGIAQANDGLAVTCLRRDGDVGGCPGLGTPTTGYMPGQAPNTDLGAVDGGGLAVIPLGAALVVAGAAATTHVWLQEDDGAWWWPVLVGLAAGGLTYGVGHAIGR